MFADPWNQYQFELRQIMKNFNAEIGQCNRLIEHQQRIIAHRDAIIAKRDATIVELQRKLQQFTTFAGAAQSHMDIQKRQIAEQQHATKCYVEAYYAEEARHRATQTALESEQNKVAELEARLAASKTRKEEEKKESRLAQARVSAFVDFLVQHGAVLDTTKSGRILSNGKEETAFDLLFAPHIEKACAHYEVEDPLLMPGRMPDWDQRAEMTVEVRFVPKDDDPALEAEAPEKATPQEATPQGEPSGDAPRQVAPLQEAS